MNEHQLRRMLRRVLLSAPLPLAVLGAACGGSSMVDPGGGASGGQQAGGGASGSPGAGASYGGASVAGANNGGASVGGASAAGASGAATAGASAAGASGAATAGASGAGTAGSGAGGSTGDACKGTQTISCAPITVTIPKTCLAAEQEVVGTQLSLDACKSICNVQYVFSCTVGTVTTTDVSVMCNPGCAVGRRPEGMCETSAFQSDEAGGYFAQIAQLEAASVTAFRVLRDELRAVGAPKRLIRAAERAARDEVRHARATGALARRFGGSPRVASIARGQLRSIEAMAIENAIEGCVRETYGALLATRQAESAGDPVVRATMMRIARDETRHASLSWRVGRWLEARLDPVAKRNVQQAKLAAARDLRLSLAREPACSFADVAGLPTPAEATRLADEMTRLLWS